EGLLPARRAQAPPVAGPEAREAVLRVWGAEVIASSGGELEELGGHLRAHDVHADILGPGVAASIPKEARERVEPAGRELTAEDVQSQITRNSVGARNTAPVIGVGSSAGSNRKPGRRSSNCVSATLVSMRARCRPRHM